MTIAIEVDGFGTEWIEAAKAVIADCSFKDYTFKIDVSRTGAVYLQAVYFEADTITAIVEEQFTRRWFLSPSMSRSEIVQTALKCIMTSMEHRTREWFLYNGRAIFQPHHDVDQLWEIAGNREIRLDSQPKAG